jgi:hypothetical protein
MSKQLDDRELARQYYYGSFQSMKESFRTLDFWEQMKLVHEFLLVIVEEYSPESNKLLLTEAVKLIMMAQIMRETELD